MTAQIIRLPARGDALDRAIDNARQAEADGGFCDDGARAVPALFGREEVAALGLIAAGWCLLVLALGGLFA